MDITLERFNRTVAVRAQDGGPVGQPLRGWLEDQLTYFERKYDFTASDGAGGIELVPRTLYYIDPKTSHLLFPYGLRPKVTNLLRAAGHRVRHTGGTILEANPKAHTLDWDGLFADFQIFPGQDECLQRIAASDGGIVAANTGWGKSIVIRMLCRLYPYAKIHVTTKSRTLAQEIFADLQQTEPTAGFVGDGKKRFSRVTMIMADSLHHGLGQADLLIADELHELCAPKYAEKLGMYQTARMFGMSATPTGRGDNRDVVGEALFGPVLYTINYQDAEAMGRVVPITVEWLRVDQGPQTGHYRMKHLRERAAIWRNDYRNELVAAKARTFTDDQQVLIMVRTIDHAVHLKSLLPGFTLAYAKDGMDEARIAGYVSNGLLPEDEPVMTGERVEQLRKEFAAGTLKKVIANYVWSTGVNFRTLAVMIRADAAASEIKDGQIPGRICRRVAGVKEAAVLVDCWDEWDGGLLLRSRKRKRNYEKRGWAQIFDSRPMRGGSSGPVQ